MAVNDPDEMASEIFCYRSRDLYRGSKNGLPSPPERTSYTRTDLAEAREKRLVDILRKIVTADQGALEELAAMGMELADLEPKTTELLQEAPTEPAKPKERRADRGAA